MPPHPLRDPFLQRARARPEEHWAVGFEGRARARGESAAVATATLAALRGLGLRPGTLISLLAPPGPAFVEALVAAFGAELCVALLDPTTTGEERERIERHLGIGWRWTLADPWEAALPLPVTSDVPGDGITALSGGAVPGAAVLKLSSGSTGAPRGVAVAAQALAADTARLDAAMGLGQEERLLVAVPLTHSYGFSVLTAPALTTGATLCFPEGAELLPAAQRLEATFLASVPAWFQALLKHTGIAALPPSLHGFLSAGAPLSAETARAFRERFGRAIAVLYGASECGGIAFDPDGGANERGAVGRVLPGVEVTLVQDEDDAGCVRVRSDAVAQGYVPYEEGDEARLAGGCYTSEDLARFEGELLVLTGRKSEWISVRGKKVDPREVEGVLRGLAGVEDVAVLGIPTPAGAGEELVRAVIAGPKGGLDVKAVFTWCATRLAPHKRPRSVLLVEALPRTERGKLDRARLRALAHEDASA